MKHLLRYSSALLLLWGAVARAGCEPAPVRLTDHTPQELQTRSEMFVKLCTEESTILIDSADTRLGKDFKRGGAGKPNDRNVEKRLISASTRVKGGAVVIYRVIGTDGTTETVGIISSSGDNTFDDAAIAFFRSLVHKPALLNGEPVRVFYSVRMKVAK